MRVGKVVAELGNEKVDIVRWNPDPITFISHALSPAQISKVILVEEHSDHSGDHSGTATVIVAEDQQSLAIGKQGQNVRLAAKLTGWKIDIRTEKQYAEEQAKKMFDLDGGGQAFPAAVTVRESQDEHAALFAIESDDSDAASADAATSDGGAVSSDETGATSSDAALTDDALLTDVGSSAPVNDVQSPASEIDNSANGAVSEDFGDTGDRASEAGSVTGGISSVAPGDSLNA
jgi:N utilization substance protein A